MTKALIREAGPLQATRVEGAKSGRLKICIATPGWGSSGYYSAKVLENAATAKVFPAGTQSFLDHETESEKYDRPERSVRDLAMVQIEDATWDADAQMLVAEVQAFGAYSDLLTDEQFTQTVGMSMRAYAESTKGEAEGRKGTIITELVEALSVDVVTRAGRGGRILEVLESAGAEQVVERAVAHGVAEATANDTREALNAALLEGYGGEKSWVWVRDFDESTVWFTHDTPDESTTYAQAYQLQDDGSALLDGDPTEVRARTEYVPVATTATESQRAAAIAYATAELVKCGATEADAARAATEALRLATTVPAPAGQPHPTHQSKEDTMGNIQVDEAQHASLTEAAGRVPTLESERDTAIQERDEARKDLAESHRVTDRSRAREIASDAAKEAQRGLNEFELAGIVADFPLTEAGRLDEDKFKTVAEAAVAKLAEAHGSGTITGFGRTTDAPSDVVAEAHAAADSAFGRTSTKGA